MNAIKNLSSRLLRSTRSSAIPSVRSLATPTPTPASLFTPILPQSDPAALHFVSGQTYEGTRFGAKKSAWGETVFSTSITSCECGIFNSFPVSSFTFFFLFQRD
jgi:carbamoyl-phosphate synthase small subunit